MMITKKHIGDYTITEWQQECKKYPQPPEDGKRAIVEICEGCIFDTVCFYIYDNADTPDKFKLDNC